ncbi:hypothetical protein CC79DRAFT_190788 [Sarocladium strictum]
MLFLDGATVFLTASDFIAGLLAGCLVDCQWSPHSRPRSSRAQALHTEDGSTSGSLHVCFGLSFYLFFVAFSPFCKGSMGFLPYSLIPVNAHDKLNMAWV